MAIMHDPAVAPPSRAGLRIYRAGIELRITAPTKLHTYPNPALYALLAAAYGRGAGIESVMPDGVLLEAPERGRVALAVGDEYHVALTILANDNDDAAQRLDLLVDGLRKLGRGKAAPRTALGGNFDLVRTVDLVAAQPHRTGRALCPVPDGFLAEQIAQCQSLPQLTLRFISPLRAERPDREQRPGHRYFDRDFFASDVFLARLRSRLISVGGEEFTPGTSPRVMANQLVWLDSSYGKASERKPCGGALGRVVLDACAIETASLLVWGQFVHVGGATRFGQGHYYIEELGRAFPGRRSAGLLELSLAHPAIDLAASSAQLESGVVRQAAAQLLAGDYQPGLHFRVAIKTGDKSRVLSIPSRLDRALQRAVLDRISPALDQLFEESSTAYRRRLGRHTAATAVRDAFSQGFHWAVKADFAAFFDRVDHAELFARLDAYLGDDDLLRAIRRWIVAGAPDPARGLPTGAPLSPLLANLLLDQFDEEISAQGARLVRYADDFLILCRRREEAAAIFAAAEDAAAALKLELNERKTALVDLREPFDFLGFRFQPYDKQWEANALSESVHVESLRK